MKSQRLKMAWWFALLGIVLGSGTDLCQSILDGFKQDRAFRLGIATIVIPLMIVIMTHLKETGCPKE